MGQFIHFDSKPVGEVAYFVADEFGVLEVCAHFGRYGVGAGDTLGFGLVAPPAGAWIETGSGCSPETARTLVTSVRFSSSSTSYHPSRSPLLWSSRVRPNSRVIYRLGDTQRAASSSKYKTLATQVQSENSRQFCIGRLEAKNALP